MYFLREQLFKKICSNFIFLFFFLGGSNLERKIFKNILLNTEVSCWLGWLILFSSYLPANLLISSPQVILILTHINISPEALDDQWCGMAPRNNTKAAKWGVGYQAWPNWLCLSNGGEFKKMDAWASRKVSWLLKHLISPRRVLWFFWGLEI